MPQNNTAESSRRQRTAAILTLVGVGLLFALLLVPGRADQFTLSHWGTIPLDAPAAVLLLIVVGKRLSWVLRFVLSILVLCLVLLRLADILSRIAFGRAFNPAAEWHLIQQGWTLTAKTIGPTEALVFTSLGALALLLLGFALFRCLGAISRTTKNFRKTLGAVCALVVVAGLTNSALSLSSSFLPPLRWIAADELVARVKYTRWAVKDQAEFSKELEVDNLSTSVPRFAALEGRDVIIIYVESYGRTFIDTPRFVDMATSRLDSVEQQISDANLFVRSAWIDSPIRGGRSWLAHSTVASGLKLTSQARFDRLITSERPSLHHLFSQAGWTSSVVLPVVQTNWVEGAWYKVDRFFDYHTLDYQGKGFGYVTVPDQYTLTAFEEKVRASADKPLMAHIGLLDSHAPWGPLPKHQDWDSIGDGSLFDGTQRFGDRHSWAKPEPVRKAYGIAVDQNLKLVGEYLSRYADDALFIIMGDHQPASVIAGWAPDAYVPMHVVSNDKALLSRLPDELFNQSMTPDKDANALPMESIRELLGTVFE